MKCSRCSREAVDGKKSCQKCLDCQKAYHKEYRKANREKIAAQKKEYRKDNCEKIAARKKEYYKANREKIAEYRKANREKIAAYDKAYQKDNQEKIAARKKEYRKDNQEKIAAQLKEYRKANREKIAAQEKEYRKANREKRRAYVRKRRATDINFRLSENLRSRLYSAVRGNPKTGSAVRDLGCSIAFLKTHLESRFQEGMSWDNYGEWHIDHIKPLVLFDLTDRDQVLEACHYTNLQPLWAADNISKGSSYDA